MRCLLCLSAVSGLLCLVCLSAAVSACSVCLLCLFLLQVCLSRLQVVGCPGCKPRLGCKWARLGCRTFVWVASGCLFGLQVGLSGWQVGVSGLHVAGCLGCKWLAVWVASGWLSGWQVAGCLGCKWLVVWVANGWLSGVQGGWASGSCSLSGTDLSWEICFSAKDSQQKPHTAAPLTSHICFSAKDFLQKLTTEPPPWRLSVKVRHVSRNLLPS